jgi:hypothetical protein
MSQEPQSTTSVVVDPELPWILVKSIGSGEIKILRPNGQTESANDDHFRIWDHVMNLRHQANVLLKASGCHAAHVTYDQPIEVDITEDYELDYKYCDDLGL